MQMVVVFTKLPMVKILAFSTSSGARVHQSLKLEKKLWGRGVEITG